MQQLAIVIAGAWFAVGVVVALAFGRAARRSGVDMVPERAAPVVPTAPEGLAARRARPRGIGARLAAAVAAVAGAF